VELDPAMGTSTLPVAEGTPGRPAARHPCEAEEARAGSGTRPTEGLVRWLPVQFDVLLPAACAPPDVRPGCLCRLPRHQLLLAANGAGWGGFVGLRGGVG
jgi:hypothetical protein